MRRFATTTRHAITRFSPLVILCLLSVASQAAQVEQQRFDFRHAAMPLAPGLAADARGLVLTQPTLFREAMFESEAIPAPFPFTAVGAHWRSRVPEGTTLRIELATSADGVEWGPWHPIVADPHLLPEEYFPDGRPNPSYGDTLGNLVHRSRGDGAWVRFRLMLESTPGAAATPSVESFALSWIDSRHPGPDAEQASDHLGSGTQQQAGAYPKPPVHSRGAWGAAPPNCSYSYCNVTHIGIHHTAGVAEYSCSGFDDCAADVRAIQAYHMNTNGWCDMGYNYLASSDGALWEGRGGGDDVRAAHDGHNCGSMGVSNMGYYHSPYNHTWTENQLDAVAELSAWKADQKGIDPYGFAFYEGLGASEDTIYGHRDVSSTACPGDLIYPRLGELKGRVADKLSGGAQEFIYDNPSVQFLIGSWTTGTSSTDKYGSDYYWANSGSGQFCVWRVDVAQGGNYDVSFWWPEGTNRSPTARLLLKESGPVQWFVVDQQTNGGQWNSMGTFNLGPGTVFLGTSSAGPSGWVVMCDAARLRLQ